MNGIRTTPCNHHHRAPSASVESTQENSEHLGSGLERRLTSLRPMASLCEEQRDESLRFHLGGLMTRSGYLDSVSESWFSSKLNGMLATYIHVSTTHRQPRLTLYQRTKEKREWMRAESVKNSKGGTAPSCLFQWQRRSFIKLHIIVQTLKEYSYSWRVCTMRKKKL